MSIITFPAGFPPVEDTEQGLMLTQGWTQAFAAANIQFDGKWEKGLKTTLSGTVSKCNFTPIASTVYLKYSIAGSDTLTFPTKGWGWLDLRDVTGVVVKSFHLEEAISITIDSIQAGYTLTGNLSRS